MRLLLIFGLQLALFVLCADGHMAFKPKVNESANYLKAALRRGDALVEEFNHEIRLYGYHKGGNAKLPGKLRKTLQKYNKTEEDWKEKLGGKTSLEKVHWEIEEILEKNNCSKNCVHQFDSALEKLNGYQQFQELAVFLLDMVQKNSNATRQRLNKLINEHKPNSSRFLPGLACVAELDWTSNVIYGYYSQFYLDFKGADACFVEEDGGHLGWILAIVGLLMVVGCTLWCIEECCMPLYMCIKARREAPVDVRVKNPEKSFDSAQSVLSTESLP